MDPIEILRERCAKASQVAVARELGVSPAYISDILQLRREPGPKVLDALGLEREVRYRRKNTKN